MCFVGQVRDAAYILERRFDIKKHRHIAWIDRINFLVSGQRGVNYSGGPCYLLPAPQGKRGERVTNSANDQPKSDESCHYSGKRLLAPDAHFAGPLERAIGGRSEERRVGKECRSR